MSIDEQIPCVHKTSVEAVEHWLTHLFGEQEERPIIYSDPYAED